MIYMILNLENLKTLDWSISGIYKIENIFSGNVYIGQAQDIRKRLREHLEWCISQNKRENKALLNAWNKYGEGCFDFEIIDICNIEELDNREKHWIAHYNSHSNGYNMTSGGQEGYRGKDWSDEERKHFSDIRNPEPVLQIDFNGNIIKEFWSIAQASKLTGIDGRGIYSCCNKGISKTAGGYIWIYKKDNDSFDLNYHLDRKQKKPVEQYDMDGNFIKLYEHGSKVEEDGFSQSVINNCCNHNSMSVYGYIWKFKDDDTRIIDKKYCEEAKRKANSVKVHKIFQVNDCCEIVNIYDSIREADRNGYVKGMVSKCCRHIIDSYKGFIWVYEDEYRTLTEEYCHDTINKNIVIKYYEIIQCNLEGVQINKYNSLNDIPSEFHKQNVSQCCRGICKQYKGYVWKYGKEITNPLSRQVEMYDKNNGKLLNVFISLKEASKITGVNESSIGQVCKHKLKSAGGFLWKYSDDNTFTIDMNYINKLNIHGSSKSLYVYDTDNKLIKIYSSITSAVDDGYTASSIRKCCKKEINTYKGYVWKYGEVS